MEKLALSIESLSLDDSKAFLSKFIKENEKTSSPPQLEDGLREQLWTVLFKHIDSEDKNLLLCLKAVRILSREKSNLSKYVNDDRVNALFKVSGITSDIECNSETSLEALKCLCNITYNLPSISGTLNSCGAAILIGKNLVNYKGRKDLLERKLFEVKLLFLITAFSTSSRQTLYKEYGLQLFTDLCLVEGEIPKENITSTKRKKLNLGTVNIKLLCEILKTTFNVLINVKSDSVSNHDEFKDFVAVARELILLGLTPTTVTLLSDIVNVLTLVPSGCLSALSVPGQKRSGKNVDKCPSMEAVSVLIDFLDAILVKIEDVPGTPKEELSPILLLLTNLAKCDRHYRRYIRTKVLPNLKEVYTRPEVGSTLRNKLCRLLTCPITSTRDLVADFLFVLCKESVGRMVKYTGYGNAAGLFANRGLLGGQVGKSSSESEDSETEEYSQHKHMINPIVGCLTPPRTDETKDMTDEQKEYLAMELVNKIDKLQREGIIQPCRVGPDGKPTPVEHILELQENGVLPMNNKQ